ncbi:MAG: hypothetical protein ACFFDP_01275 [Promethearchaeota archaeon]
MSAEVANIATSRLHALGLLEKIAPRAKLSPREMEADCLVTVAAEFEVQVTVVASWVEWQVAAGRRCAILLERGQNATAVADALKAHLPDVRILVWVGQEVTLWPAPLQYDVVVCSYRRFWNRFARNVRCGFHAVVAWDLDVMLLSSICVLVEALVARWRLGNRPFRLMGVTRGCAQKLVTWLYGPDKDSSEDDSYYVVVDSPKCLSVTFKPLTVNGDLEVLGINLVARPSRVAAWISPDFAMELAQCWKNAGVEISIYGYGRFAKQSSVDVAIVNGGMLTQIELREVAAFLKEGGELVILYRDEEDSFWEGGEKRASQLLELRQLVRQTLGVGPLQECPIDWEMFLLHLFRHTLPCFKGLELCQCSFAAMFAGVKPPSIEEFEILFMRLQDEGLVQRHGTLKSRFGGTAHCTENGENLAKTIYTASVRRAVLNRYAHHSRDSDEPDWLWIIQAAAELTGEEQLEAEFCDLLKTSVLATVDSSKPPRWLRPGLFAISALDAATARFIEQHARKIGILPIPTTDILPYSSPRRHRPHPVALRKVIRFVFGALAQGILRPSQRKIAARTDLHYAEVAATLDLPSITVYQIFRDYFEYNPLTPKQITLVKGLGVSSWNQLLWIRRSCVLTHYHVGFHRPRLLLVRIDPEARGEPVVPERYRRTCGECVFFDAEAQVCALWYQVASVRQDLVEEQRAGRRQTSRHLNGCRYFTAKTSYHISEKKLKAATIISPREGVYEVRQCDRPGCSGYLNRIPRVGTVGQCNRCGTTYRKTPRGRLYVQIGVLDLLQHEVRAIAGTLPSNLLPKMEAPSIDTASLYLTSDDTIQEVSREQIVISYHQGRLIETYPLDEVGTLSLPAGKLDKATEVLLIQQGIRVIQRSDPSVPKHPIPAITKALKQGVGNPTLFRRHCVAQYLSLLHATASLYPYFERDVINRLLWRQLDRLYLFSHAQISSDDKERIYLRACEGQMAYMFHATLRSALATFGATDTSIGRVHGRRVRFRGSRLGLARGWTHFDAALNLASRLLRSHLRAINAGLGLGWQTLPLFLHTPRDHPGLGVHLDLEEVPRLALTLSIFQAFNSGQIAQKDFKCQFTPLQIPFYSPNSIGYQKLHQLVNQLLEIRVLYCDKLLSLDSAHQHHVSHLLDILQSGSYIQYKPLLWVPHDNIEQIWRDYAPLRTFNVFLLFQLGEPFRSEVSHLLKQNNVKNCERNE